MKHWVVFDGLSIEHSSQKMIWQWSSGFVSNTLLVRQYEIFLFCLYLWCDCCTSFFTIFNNMFHGNQASTIITSNSEWAWLNKFHKISRSTVRLKTIPLKCSFGLYIISKMGMAEWRETMLSGWKKVNERLVYWILLYIIILRVTPKKCTQG